MPERQKIVTEYMREKKLNYRSLAAQMSAVLAERPYSPRSISYTTLWHWATGTHLPDPLRLEYIAQNAKDPDLRQFALKLLDRLVEASPVAVQSFDADLTTCQQDCDQNDLHQIGICQTVTSSQGLSL